MQFIEHALITALLEVAGIPLQPTDPAQTGIEDEPFTVYRGYIINRILEVSSAESGSLRLALLHPDS